MSQIVLFAIIVFLLSLSLTLYFRLRKLQNEPTSSKHAALQEEEVFQILPLPTLYKKNAKWYTNKAFSRAFGAMSKETAELLNTLPKSGEHMHELVFDNDITKQAMIYTAPLLGSSNDFVAIIVDIAHLHKSKSLLLQQKERLELALEGSNEAIWDWDMKSDVVFYSQKWKQLMGYEPKENPSTLSSWLNLVHTKDMALVNERLKAHLDGNTEFFVVDHRIRQSEPLRWINVRGRVIRGKNDQNIRMVGTIRDISERKEEEVKEHLEQERFIAFVENIPALAFIKNTQGNYLYMNQSYQKFIGFKTWKNRNAFDLFDAQTAQNIAETDRLALYEGVVEHEIALPTLEGLQSHFHLYEFIIDEENEKLLCGFSINKPFKE
ncbi:PAS domain-containing protein [Sulfurospirillum oryzae]|uniref:PAS domain-containing protein n=1 Tax=Sulfurospirillum oryzae TaxID=2976535 RepID=UPI0021E74E9C|nr:PAS domain S-box protein [Sulfurospirillum oryzae]